MPTFDDRENAFENKYAHDAEMQFKAEARRNKLLGLWVAEALGKSGDDATAYAVEVVKSDFEEAGHEDVMRKVMGDLNGKLPEAEIRAKYEELMPIAKAQLMDELQERHQGFLGALPPFGLLERSLKCATALRAT
ncbi:MAG: DUF1476 domain-containing protein [Roseicyclus sp.]|nr:DUF1476 domain-containing protein [Roseicyclus sp.]